MRLYASSVMYALAKTCRLFFKKETTQSLGRSGHMMPDHLDQNPKTAPANRRRQYIVHPKIQWKHALTLGAAVFLFCIILSCGLFASLHEEARRRVINPAEYRGSLFTVILSASLVYSALTAGVICFWMLLTTHRLCGPVYVLEQNLECIAEGRIPQLRPLRAKDEFKDVFVTFGRAIDRVRKDKEVQLAGVNKALASARDDRFTCEQECRDALEAVRCQLEGLRACLTEGLGQPADAPKKARPQPVPAGAA
jgi:hypothetical protein